MLLESAQGNSSEMASESAWRSMAGGGVRDYGGIVFGLRIVPHSGTGHILSPEPSPQMTLARAPITRRSTWLAAIPRLFLAVGLASAGGTLAMETAAAQSATATLNVPPQAGIGSVSAINARRGVLFTQMMAQPANIELAFEYAALSSRVGDIEAAISTLERMLIFAPDLARLKLELGALYFRL